MLSPARPFMHVLIAPILGSLFLGSLIMGPVSMASAQSLSHSSAPIEITADDAIEWLRDQHLYRATGKAMVKQGHTTITADRIEASYDPQKGEQDIQSVTATGHVTIISDDRTITADHAVYDLAQGLATLTGSVITLNAPDMKIVAYHKVIYNEKQRHAVASGKASVTAQNRTLTADQIEVWLSEAKTASTSAGQNMGQLERARARGHVVIKTAKEIIQADQADYHAIKQEAIMTGHVRLTQGENHMQGERAVVNLKTGVSQLFGQSNSTASAPSSGGRVKAIFFPGKNNNSFMPGDTARDMIPLRPDDDKPKGQSK
jgi:lipopolysaccharide export system protein LptA